MAYFSINDVKRKIKLPEESKELAEFMGILTGDGYMNLYGKYDYRIEINGNKIKDKNYLSEYVTRLIKRLFNLTPKYLKKSDQNTACLIIRSKGIYQFLLKKCFKKGKKEEIKIPGWVKNKSELVNYFIKGLFDTDGCISLKNKEGTKYPVASITSKSKGLLTEVQAYLKKEGVNANCYQRIEDNLRYKEKIITYKLEVNGFKNLNRFYELIGSSNSRNISKYKESIDFLAHRQRFKKLSS